MGDHGGGKEEVREHKAASPHDERMATSGDEDLKSVKEEQVQMAKKVTAFGSPVPNDGNDLLWLCTRRWDVQDQGQDQSL